MSPTHTHSPSSKGSLATITSSGTPYQPKNYHAQTSSNTIFKGTSKDHFSHHKRHSSSSSSMSTIRLTLLTTSTTPCRMGEELGMCNSSNSSSKGGRLRICEGPVVVDPSEEMGEVEDRARLPPCRWMKLEEERHLEDREGTLDLPARLTPIKAESDSEEGVGMEEDTCTRPLVHPPLPRRRRRPDFICEDSDLDLDEEEEDQVTTEMEARKKRRREGDRSRGGM
jgi:hypothetical protein